MQLVRHDRVAVSSGSQVFLLARFVEDGVAKDYLEAHCPETHFAFCAFVDRMPMSTNDFLWRQNGPVKSLGGVEAVRDEAATIVAGSLREQPLRIAWLSLGHTLNQLTKLRMDRYVQQFYSGNAQWNDCATEVKDRAPFDYASYIGSRQARYQIDMQPIFWLQRPFIVVSAVLLLVLLCTSAALRADRRFCELLWLAVSALLANAFICGALSGPDDRYESRMIWLVPLLLCLALLIRRTRSTPPKSTPVRP